MAFGTATLIPSRSCTITTFAAIVPCRFRISPMMGIARVALTNALSWVLFFAICSSTFSAGTRATDQEDPRLKNVETERIFGIFDGIKHFKYRSLVSELFGPIPRPPRHSRVVVIGSGFGGSISTFRLAQAGIQTTVLERGQRWPIDGERKIHTYEPARDGRGLWHRRSSRVPIAAEFAPRLPVDDFGGVLDITEYDGIEVWRGACVGGGSKVFTGLMNAQPDARYFDEIFKGVATFREMNDTYFPRVRNVLRLSPVPEDVYTSEPFGKSRVWDEQARNAGYRVERPDSIFNWDTVRAELDGTASKSATIGLSNMGNSNGAKFDMTQNYLPQAEVTGHARVYPNQCVRDIEQRGSLYTMHIDELSQGGAVIDRYSITCDFLILSAGSIGTTELLVKARAKGLVPGLETNSHIGRGWGANGDAIVTRTFNPVQGITQASPCTSFIHDARGSIPATMEAWYVPGVPVDLSIQGSLCIAYDRRNRGRFHYDAMRDTVNLLWPRGASDATVESCRRINNILAEAEPQSVPGVPLLAPDVWAGFTAHPLGGIVVGRAIDKYGRVHGAQGLYVMDGAMVPGTTGAMNPSLTISALVERNIEAIIEDDFGEEQYT